MKKMRIAAIADLHCKTDSRGKIAPIFEGVEKEADIVVIAGDLTNIGLVEEMEVLLEELNSVELPIIAVIGNHDHENDQANLLVNMMAGRDICVLDCNTCEVEGVGFVGAKGFCGGFLNRRVQPFGERAIKTFVQTSIDEVVCMEEALETLDTDRKIAVLHYSPIKETLEGESPELYPFLGSSLLADAVERHGVDVIFHGHAHNGSPFGTTSRGIPVHNVSRFVQRRFNHKEYLIYETT